MSVLIIFKQYFPESFGFFVYSSIFKNLHLLSRMIYTKIKMPIYRCTFFHSNGIFSLKKKKKNLFMNLLDCPTPQPLSLYFYLYFHFLYLTSVISLSVPLKIAFLVFLGTFWKCLHFCVFHSGTSFSAEKYHLEF